MVVFTVLSTVMMLRDDSIKDAKCEYILLDELFDTLVVFSGALFKCVDEFSNGEVDVKK